jgi:hypothetical protein
VFKQQIISYLIQLFGQDTRRRIRLIHGYKKCTFGRFLRTGVQTALLSTPERLQRDIARLAIECRIQL